MIPENKVIAAAKAILPNFIMYGGLPYRLNCHMLMGGSIRISYVNGYLDENNRIVLDQIWLDPFDCMKVVWHDLHNTLGWQEISEAEFNCYTRPFNKNADLVEKKEGN